MWVIVYTLFMIFVSIAVLDLKIKVAYHFNDIVHVPKVHQLDFIHLE